MNSSGTPRPQNPSRAESVVLNSSSSAEPGSSTPAEVNRDIYREMIRGLIKDNQLDRSTQREAIEFARHLAIDATEAAAIIASAWREVGLTAGRTAESSMDATPPSVTGVALVVLLLNAIWFGYVLSR